MKQKKVRKTLCVKVGEDFYEEVVNYSYDNHINISNLIRRALFETYGLAESEDSKTTKYN